MVWKIIGVVFATGCIGGLVSGLFYRPKKMKQLLLWYPGEVCSTHFPGLLANVLLGGFAAVVFWCLYGPFSGATIIGSSASTTEVGLTVGQLGSCLLIGMGGAGFLLTEASRRCGEDQIRQMKDKSKAI